jgi:uncharacterized protein (TIGR00299 family) protein
MTRHLHIDPVTGVSGDMLLGALVDAGAPIDSIRADLDRLGVDGWRLDVDRVVRHGLTGSLASVTTADTASHRPAGELQQLIAAAGLAPAVAVRATSVIERLAVAEADIHGIAQDDVHLHEIGALDTIVDVVGVCSALHLLDVGTVTCGPLPTGSGTVTTAHGELPVPAPATLRVLAGTGHVWSFTDDPMELVTPTGAALVAEYADPAPGSAMSVDAVGYGFGSSNRLGRANCVRVLLGRTAPSTPATEQIVVLHTTIDDQSPELLASALDACIDAGAVDAWTSPVVMKQRRLGSEVTIICPPDAESTVVDRLFELTTTLGVRRSLTERYVAPRSEEIVDVDGVPVRVKFRTWAAGPATWKPEHRDVVHAASVLGCTPAEVAHRVDALIRRRGQ